MYLLMNPFALFMKCLRSAHVSWANILPTSVTSKHADILHSMTDIIFLYFGN